MFAEADKPKGMSARKSQCQRACFLKIIAHVGAIRSTTGTEVDLKPWMGGHGMTAMDHHLPKKVKTVVMIMFSSTSLILIITTFRRNKLNAARSKGFFSYAVHVQHSF